jgi:hypothetical protein
MLFPAKKSQEYKALSNANEDLNGEEELRPHLAKPPIRQSTIAHIICLVLSLIIAFTTGVLLTIYISNPITTHGDESGTVEKMHIAPHIPLHQIAGKFVYPSPFSKEAPREGNISEPTWDALIPSTSLSTFNHLLVSAPTTRYGNNRIYRRPGLLRPLNHRYLKAKGLFCGNSLRLPPTPLPLPPPASLLHHHT